MSNKPECKNCRGEAQNFLCARCESSLRDMLISLARDPQNRRSAGWLEILQDAALGKTKLGSPERRSPRYRQGLDGEQGLSTQIELLPGEVWEVIEGPAREGEQWPVKVPADEDDPIPGLRWQTVEGPALPDGRWPIKALLVVDDIKLFEARRQRSKSSLQHALGAARINLRASELWDYTHSVLCELIRDICHTHRVEVPAIKATDGMALWLARNVSAISADEGAAVCYREIKQIIGDIERVVDRPEPRRFCGPCPNVVDGHRQRCSVALMAKRDAASVICPSCRAAHSVDELIERLLAEVDDWLFARSEIWLLLGTLNERVPYSTFHDWFKKGRIKPHDHQQIGEKTVPRYRLSAVRELREKPQKAATGAAARKRPA